MKLFVGAAALGLALASAAIAQTPATLSRCGELAPAPPITVDGATSSAQDIEAANVAFAAWAQETQGKLACRFTEIEEQRVALNARESEYNTGAEQLNTSIAAWRVEVDEFNARPQRSRPRVGR